MNEVVGIDLGTTFSLAAFVRDGVPEVVRDAQGIALVPSVLSFHEDGSVHVGSEARARALSDPEHVVFSIKRLMGRTLADLTKDSALLPQQIVEREGENGRKVLCVRIAGKDYPPEELSAMILREVRQRAGNPTKAVITVPAYFDDSQRQATRDAGRIAGLDVLRIVNEPTAAALAYGLQAKKNGTIAVYDLGGGTFDCSILSLADGTFKVLSTNGDTYLGGDDFDRAIMRHAATAWGIDLTIRDALLLQRLRDTAEKAKILLSSQPTAELSVGEHRLILTRVEFEALIAPLVKRSIDKCKSAMRDASVTKDQITDVVLVGGSSRIPLVRAMVAEFFGKPPHTDLNPDEVVALGAAVQADILSGNRREMLLLDVVPLSLGIETMGGVVDKVIHRNTTVPCRATTRYTTYAENQTAITLNIYQGERELTKDCRLLGAFKLAGIPPMPAQMAQCDVTFLVDADGLLTVRAKEQRSGKEIVVTVQAAHGLNNAEVERLVLDSVENAHADFDARQRIEWTNKAHADIKHAERALAQAGDRLTSEQSASIRAARTALDAALQSGTASALRHATEAFGHATLPLAELVMNDVVRRSLSGKTSLDLENPS